MKSNASSLPTLVFVISSLRNGGAEQCVVNAAEAALIQGLDAEILVLSATGLSRRSKRIQSITTVAKIEKTILIPLYLWQISSRLRRPMLIIPSFWPIAVAACAFALFSQVPKVAFWEHAYTSKYSFFDLALIRFFFRRLDCVIGWERSYTPLLDIMPSLRTKALPLGNPINYTILDQQSHTNQIFVVCVCSRLVKSKNIQLSLQAFACFAKNNQAELRIYGDGPADIWLKEISVDLGIDNLVKFYGATSDIPQQLANSDVLLVTSPREGFCNVILESIFAGTPVISVLNGSIGDVILQDKSLGHIADPTPESISRCLIDISLRRPRIHDIPSSLFQYDSKMWVRTLLARSLSWP